MPEKIWSYCDGIPDNIKIPEISVIDLFRQTADKYPDRNMTSIYNFLFRNKFFRCNIYSN